MMDKTSPADWLYVLALIQVWGLKYLLAAGDGTHYGISIHPKKRWLALCVGLALIWIPYLLVWVLYGMSPVQLWTGLSYWWNIGFWVGKVFAILYGALLLSPLYGIYALYTTFRANQRHKQREEWMLRAYDDYSL